MRKGIFVSATDTGVGKTIASLVIATALKNKGIDAGFMKPAQCAGNDARFIKAKLKIEDPLKLINPHYAKEPLCPGIAFKRKGMKFDKQKVLRVFKNLSFKHDFLVVEGAGGLFVPLNDKYLIADLIRDLNLPLVIVSRLGLGTINHTLLTIKAARQKGIKVFGVIFNCCKPGKPGISERTNPQIIRKLGKIPILGILPYLPSLSEKNIIKAGKNINLNLILSKNV